MNEHGRDPSLVLPHCASGFPGCSTANSISAYTYRGTVANEEGLYQAKILRHISGDWTLVKPLPHIPVLKVGKPLACEGYLTYAIDHGTVGNPTAPDEIDTSSPDSRREVTWTYQNCQHIEDPSLSTDSAFWLSPEDHLRTNAFSLNTGESIRITAITALPDSATLASWLPDSSHSLSLQLILKDSVTSATMGILGGITFVGGRIDVPILDPVPGVPFLCGSSWPFSGTGSIVQKHDWISTSPAMPSAYLTIRVAKDPNTDLDIQHIHTFSNHFVVPDSTIELGLKRREDRPMQISTLDLSVHPNPSTNAASVDLSLREGLQTNVEVYDMLGNAVMLLYSGVPNSSQQVQLSLDGRSLPSGSYFIRVQEGATVRSIKFELLK